MSVGTIIGLVIAQLIACGLITGTTVLKKQDKIKKAQMILFYGLAILISIVSLVTSIIYG